MQAVAGDAGAVSKFISRLYAWSTCYSLLGSYPGSYTRHMYESNIVPTSSSVIWGLISMQDLPIVTLIGLLVSFQLNFLWYVYGSFFLCTYTRILPSRLSPVRLDSYSLIHILVNLFTRRDTSCHSESRTPLFTTCISRAAAWIHRQQTGITSFLQPFFSKHKPNRIHLIQHIYSHLSRTFAILVIKIIMDLLPSLQTLGIDDLADITLNELEDRIQHVHPDQLSKQDVLQVFMRWLHERIKKDIQQKSLLSEFANLLLTGGKLQQGPFSEDEIKEALKEWQSKDAVETPANIRRYQMVQLDFHELFEQARRGSKQEKDSSTRSTSNQEGNSLVRLNKLINSQDIAEMEIMESTAPWVPGRGKQKTGANEIPLGRKAGLRSNFYNEIVKIREENERKSSTKVNKAPPVEQTARLSSRDATSMEASPIKSYEPVISDYSSLNMPPYLTTSPPYGYICKRCDQPGNEIR